MKLGVSLVNVSWGLVVNIVDLINVLKDGLFVFVVLDIVEGEGLIFNVDY